MPVKFQNPIAQAGGQNPTVRLFVRDLKTEDGSEDLNLPVKPPQDVAQQWEFQPIIVFLWW